MVAAFCNGSIKQVNGASPDTPLRFCQELVRDQREATASQNASNLAELEASLRLEPKRVPCGLLYDDIGSQLYDDITKLPVRILNSHRRPSLGTRSSAAL